MIAAPRIYTYKVTFPAQGWWYWGAHKEKRHGEPYSGSPFTHKEKWKWFHWELEILEFFNSWEEALAVEKRLIAPDVNNPNCLNERVQGILSTEALRRGGRKSVELGHGFDSFDKEVLSQFGRNVGKNGGGGVANGKSEHCAFKNSDVQRENGKRGGVKNKGKKWYNDGEKETRAHHQPPGYEPGRLKRLH